jgi:hypothetical protein
MSKPTPRRVRIFNIVLGFFIAITLAMFIIPVCNITSRHSRNQPLVKELTKDVQAAFPTASFHGGYGHEGDRMRISIESGLDTIDIEALKKWLHAKKAEKKISANLFLQYPDYREEMIGP